MDKTPEQIAAGLTDAERGVVLTGNGNRLDALAVFRIGPDIAHQINIDEGYGRLSFFTPFGLAVRAILQQENTNAD